ncbi:MAG: type II toxin-antitoxin system RelE/ParE family toxin [Prevotella sp.]|jgi:phage-related protein
MSEQSKRYRKITFYKNYFKDFYVQQPGEVRRKINYSLTMVETQRVVPVKFFRNIKGSDGLYEIRAEYGGNIFRILCCMDKGSVVVLFQGFQKKTQKTPTDEIRQAEKLKKEYFSSKEGK